jgi:ABC-2 type transport system permease protein
VSQTAILAARTVRRSLRSPALMISSLITPLLLLFTMLVMLRDVIGRDAGGHDYLVRLAPLAMLSTATIGAALTSADFYRELHEGIYDRLRTMPVPLGSVLVGRVLGDLLRGLLAALSVTVVAFLPGFRFDQGVLGVLGYFGVYLIVAFMTTWLAILVATLCTTDTGPQNALNAPMLLLFFLSSGFVPLHDFPAVAQPVVAANPLSTADNALIGLSAGGPVMIPVLQTLAWSAGVGLICALLAIRRLTALANR